MAKKKPVSVWGIEFDALIEETKTMAAEIPKYPVESGFSVSDAIINAPLQIDMTLYISNTPVTWLYRHGTSKSRVKRICKKIEQKWSGKKPTKIVTPDATYMDMGITSISIKKSASSGYAREVSISAQKVRKTKRKAVKVPEYVRKSGETMADAGRASTSKESAKAFVREEKGKAEVLERKVSSSTATTKSGTVKRKQAKNGGNASRRAASALFGAASEVALR